MKVACAKETIGQGVATWNKVLSSAERVACCEHNTTLDKHETVFLFYSFLVIRGSSARGFPSHVLSALTPVHHEVRTGLLVTLFFYGSFSTIVMVFAEPLVDGMVPASFIVTQESRFKVADAPSELS